MKNSFLPRFFFLFHFPTRTPHASLARICYEIFGAINPHSQKKDWKQVKLRKEKRGKGGWKKKEKKREFCLPRTSFAMTFCACFSIVFFFLSPFFLCDSLLLFRLEIKPDNVLLPFCVQVFVCFSIFLPDFFLPFLSLFLLSLFPSMVFATMLLFQKMEFCVIPFFEKPEKSKKKIIRREGGERKEGKNRQIFLSSVFFCR